MSSENYQTPAVEFRNVCLNFDGNQVLNNVNLKLQKGEMLLLTGESGSGKSVLLRLAIGLLKPDSGQIFVHGKEIDTMDESELLAVRGGFMGIVFQEESLFRPDRIRERSVSIGRTWMEARGDRESGDGSPALCWIGWRRTETT